MRLSPTSLAPLRLLPALLGAARRHPMPTSLAKVVVQPSGREATVSLRIFADDFDAVVAPLRQRLSADSAAFAYVRNAFVVGGAVGAVSLRPIGVRRVGGVVWLDLGVPLTSGRLSGVRIIDRIMFERYDDQVNIVRASEGGRTASLLFTRGDGAKALP